MAEHKTRLCIYRGIELEKVLIQSPSYLFELLKIKNIIISPTTLEIIQNRIINIEIPKSDFEKMKLKHDIYLKNT